MRIKNVENAFFLVLLLLVTVAFVVLIEDFWQPVFWAAVLAILFAPVQGRWKRLIGGRRSLAAVLTILTVLVVVILPLFLVGLAVTNEVVRLYERIASGEIDLQAPIREAERLLPLANDYLDRFGVDLEEFQQKVSNTAVTVSQFLATRALAFGQDALRIGALFFIMLYVLFFFLRDGNRILDVIVRALPLGDERERQLFAKFAEVSRATIKGTLVVGVVQGALGALLFWILGIGAPVFWGVIMTILSLLPAVGSALVWLPASIILLATGQIVQGVILLVAGTLLIGLVDNVLRPLLVGRDTKMPDYLILLATLGGLTLFGLSGFVVGPVIAALFLVTWQMFEQEFSGADDPGAVIEAARHPEAVPDSPPKRILPWTPL